MGVTRRNNAKAPPAGSGEERLLRDRVNALSEKARSVLALATIARLWEEQFPGGWVTQAQAATHSVHFERVREGEASEANRIGFVRSRNALCSEFSELQPEQQLIQGVAAFRIGPSAPEALREWVVAEAPTLLERPFWESYLAPHEPWQVWLSSVEAYTATEARRVHIFHALDIIEYLTERVLSREQFRAKLQEHAALMLSDFRDRLVPRGLVPSESINTLTRLLSGIASRYDERYLLRHLDFVALRLILNFAEPALVMDMGETRLGTLLSYSLPVRTPADQLLVGRIHLDWLEWAFRTVVYFGDHDLDRALLKRRRHHLNAAASRARYFSHLDRSRLAVHQGLLQMAEARFRPDFETSLQLMLSAERSFEDAFAQAQSASDIEQTALAMQYRAACIFQRSILDGYLTADPRALMVNVLMAQARFLLGGDDTKTHSGADVMYYVVFTTMYQATRDMRSRNRKAVNVPAKLPLDMDWAPPELRWVFALRDRHYACLADVSAAASAPEETQGRSSTTAEN